MRDQQTPEWVQHLALEVTDMDTLHSYQQRLQESGIEVIGPTDHKICQSIYFFDPNGHRLELTVNTITPDLSQKLKAKSESLLDQWAKTKRAPDVDLDMHS